MHGRERSLDRVTKVVSVLVSGPDTYQKFGTYSSKTQYRSSRAALRGVTKQLLCRNSFYGQVRTATAISQRVENSNRHLILMDAVF